MQAVEPRELKKQVEGRGETLSWNGGSMYFAFRWLAHYLNSHKPHAESDN
jgi:hypothetical protein